MSSTFKSFQSFHVFSQNPKIRQKNWKYKNYLRWGYRLRCASARQAAEVVKEAKRVSSLWLKTKGISDFTWQSGYGIFSIGISQVETARRYIAKQDEHHRKISFQDEYRKLLRRYEIEFDERYVWD